ncbi:MAG: PilZ domain-containing protein [Acidobacteria bacterium]|nr:PilZ domain-containing protein [Acidobacteriota bacterium]
MIRKLINRFSRKLTESTVPNRRRFRAPVKVWFQPDINTQSEREKARLAFISGETIDMSRTGLAISTPVIRLKEKYLVGQERKLTIEISLPTGKVQFGAIGKRYEKIGSDVNDERFLVGVHILSCSDADREAYTMFLRKGGRLNGAASAITLNADVK